ncbi:solute carrier family 22 member 5-like isoform X2 [Syngnathus acus]|uniref:solute carrier family 22 member 5-like isoform X2 n=1 Tax=Syngnathus acus TaxID=161584 RepID=UPI001886344B|nr:solute carrier family 22 member 5-like isoform X2 [Syngnathus acus]
MVCEVPPDIAVFQFLQLVSGRLERSSCSRFQLSRIQNLSASGLRSHAPLSSLPQEGCKDGWTFSTEHYQSTVVTEFALVCDEQWKAPLSTLAYFLGGLCGCFISGQLSDRFGRKPVLLACVALLGKFGILAGLSVLYTYSGELYPTVIRNTALSSCATFSRLGSAVSPYILQLGVWYELLPWILVGSLSVFGVVLSVFLPETFTQPLPDTIQQMATMRKWPCSSCAAKHDGKPSEDNPGPEVIWTTHF